MVHTLRIDNYTPTPRKLVLGTNSSFGTESIKIERGAGWDGLALTATWHIPGREEPLRVALLDGDAMDVPPEVTKEAKDGVLVLAGLASGVQRASCNVEYLILEQAGVYGGADAEPTPELAAQVLEAALQAKADAEAAAEDAAAAKANADKAQADAEKAQQAAENAAADAAKAGPYAEAARAAQEAAESARDEAIAAQRAAENAAAAAAASKIAADTLAAEAARAAKAAEDSKAAANNAASFAGKNATAAQQAAGTATAAANDAGQSASDAAASKATAETAAKAAQDAQTAAAAAKAEAVKAQGAAQTAAKSAQDAQAAAEKARDDAQTARQGAEAARDAAAGSAEAAAKSEENAKQSADTLAESVENVAANTAAVAELKEKKAEIDDTAVGADAWSSKHIVDMLCPPLEESGNPVVCYPVVGYPLGVKAKWEPTQEGTGTPSPENIRPIKGHDSVTVTRCGENLLNPELNAYNTYTPYGLTITYIGDNKVHLKGTYTVKDGSFVILDSNQKLLAGRNLKITGFTIDGTKQTYRLYGLRTKDETAIAMNTEFADGDVIDMTVAIVVSKDTPTAYTPYIGQTNTLTLPETVYGGEVDAVSGEGNNNTKIITLDGTEKVVVNNKSNKTSVFILSFDAPAKPFNGTPANLWIVSSHFIKATILYFSSAEPNTIWYNDVGTQMRIAWNPGNKPAATIDEFKAFLAAQYAAGTPVQIAYKLAESVPFTATGAQPIPAIAGANTVLTDADSATVTGRADPIKRITDLEDAVASQT
nr:MAG TPA: L SHAPED TAIL FIBER PROTEIN [Caudoviricetes sp.]